MVSVIAVNHNSSILLKECFSSAVTAIANEAFEFIAVDSGSKEEDVKALRSLEGENIQIILNRENIGYAKAVNAGIQTASGDVILITNPDVVYKPDSIKNMINVLLESPRCGAVGPRMWWDNKMTFLLPSGEIVSPYWLLKTELMRVSQTVSEIALKGWIRKTLRYWLSEKASRQKMLSGACIMTTKRVLDAVGGFDEAFPLYFEDTDWCLRVRKAGYYLTLVPRAHVIHYYNQSAQQDMHISQEKYRRSLDRYIAKHYMSQFRLIQPALNLLKTRYEKTGMRYYDMGSLSTPPAFRFESKTKKLILLSPVDFMIPAAGSFFEGHRFQIPEELWDYLGEGRYFVKVLELDDFRYCGAWSWIKHSSS